MPPHQPDPPSLADQKQALRRLARARRIEAANLVGGQAGLLLRGHIQRDVPVPGRAVIAGYWPVGAEIDPVPTLIHYARAGHSICLPCVNPDCRDLTFRRWSPGPLPRLERFSDIPPPPAHAKKLEPSVLLVPLLGFDRAGNRLGQGAGHYDASLALLRQKRRRVLAIGVAYAAQEFPRLPAEGHDQSLDWIATEEEAFPVG